MVITMIIFSVDKLSAVAINRLIASNVRSFPSEDKSLVEIRPAPRRVVTSWRAKGKNVSPSLRATSNRTELVPISMTAPIIRQKGQAFYFSSSRLDQPTATQKALLHQKNGEK
ncbi:MAG: hypothetical protein M1552_00505 [Firmicutes bacterium]|nr:hypothetical protein [Bacillota bacterium]MCL5992650.1 hypothetical protein [Bacillota bacterium]